MGYLTAAVGDVVADGDHSLTFRLYEQASGGSAVWELSGTVTTTDGLFSVVLGAVVSLDDVPFDRACHLGISIGGGDEISPRVALVASPCSLYAKSMEAGSVTAASIVEGAVGTEAVLRWVAAGGGCGQRSGGEEPHKLWDAVTLARW